MGGLIGAPGSELSPLSLSRYVTKRFKTIAKLVEHVKLGAGADFVAGAQLLITPASRRA